MAVYYWNLVLILALGLPLCVYKPNKIKKAVYIGISMAYLWFLATFRQGIGFDYYSYIEIFEQVRQARGFTALMGVSFELGFTLLTKVMTLFIHDPTVMYGVYELLILAPIAWFIYRYCRDAWFSVWLYVTLTFFYTSMNFTRQSLACSVVVLGYRFLRDKKMVRFLLIVALAALFHKTALIMAPVYFLCHIKLNKKTGIAYGALVLTGYLTSGLILDFVTDYIFTYYKGDATYLSAFSPIFLVVPIAVLGACLALWSTWRKRYPEADMLLNLMLFSATAWLFITKHMILERFSMYLYIFCIIAVPQAISCLLRPQEDLDKLEKLQAAAGKGAKSKSEQGAIKTLAQSIDEHKRYYWSAVVAMLALTLIYHEFGANVNGFHRVFPYRTSIVALQPAEVHQVLEDGTQVTVAPDGTQVAVYTDGARLTKYMDNTWEQVNLDGTQINGTTDGTQITVYPDDTRETLYPDGTKHTQHPDGSWEQVNPDGTTEAVVVEPAPAF